MALDVKISFSWTNYCRLCLLDNGIMLPIFEGEGQNRQLGHKIETCLQLVTYDGDPLPRRICHNCLFKVTQMYEFRTMALESYERLQTHLLPLKHVPEVQQYLLRANQLQKSLGSQSVPIANEYSTPSFPPTSRSDLSGAFKPKIHVKSEKDLMDDSFSVPADINPLVGTFQSSEIDHYFGVPKLNPVQDSWSGSGTSVVRSSVVCDTPASLSSNLQNDSLKRKRSHVNLSKASQDVEISPLEVKKIKMKKRLAGPASKKKWKCVFCDALLSSKSNLASHMNKCLKCSTCGKEFNSLTEKAIHEADKHISVFIDIDRKHLRRRCTRCDARFSSSVMLAAHSRFDHPASEVSELRGASKGKLIPSIEAPSSSKGSSFCQEESGNINHDEVCSSENDDRVSLPDGEPNNDEDKLECSKCSRAFSSLQLLEIHLRDHEETKAHHCTLCNEVFASSTLLQEHGELMHSTSTVFKCQSCDQCFKSLNSLNGHQRSHSLKSNKNSKQSVDHSNSALKKTATVKRKTWTCHTCFEEFDEEDPFVLHLYRHATGQSDDESIPKKKSRKIQSSQGGTSLSSSEETEIVSEQFSVKCERCHVVCRSKEYYKVHLATHVSKAKTSFPCSGCAQVFRNVEALNRHTCSGNQPESVRNCCLDCGQALVIGEDHACDNKCPQCEKVFKSARGQRLHFSSKHRNLIMPIEDAENFDREVIGSDVNSCETDDFDSSGGKEVHSTLIGSLVNGLGDSETCSKNEVSPLPMERLPPDGAAPDLPLSCGSASVISDKVPLSVCNDTNSDNIPLSVYKSWLPLPKEVNDVPPEKSCEFLQRPERPNESAHLQHLENTENRDCFTFDL